MIEAKKLRVKDACNYFSWSRGTLMKYADQANAISWVGRMVFIDCERLNQFIEANRGNKPPKRREPQRASL